ncbi:MAG TPA: putative metalloprotease CJM1_0395 family protein, partial [Candidatus Accumulibacter phosphatis]|nr:putative metalloprotease CJM1_0395 family protein [Candidatus Accumulibacter phosphatis]
TDPNPDSRYVACHAAGRCAAASAQQKGQLSEADRQRLQSLQRSDRLVRAHEMAHVAAGGSLVRSGASFSYAIGPDGQRYAVGGEVGIDTSPGRSPEETLDKAARIRAAALAPADPSPQDRQVAAMATRMAMQASMELALRRDGTAGTTAAADSRAAGATTVAAYAGVAATGGEAPAAAIDLFA